LTAIVGFCEKGFEAVKLLGDADIAFHGWGFAAFFAMQYGHIPTAGVYGVHIRQSLLASGYFSTGHLGLCRATVVLTFRVLAVVDLDSVARGGDAWLGNLGKYFTHKNNPLFAKAYKGL
jgi:hypothetical protein